MITLRPVGPTPRCTELAESPAPSRIPPDTPTAVVRAVMAANDEEAPIVPPLGMGRKGPNRSCDCPARMSQLTAQRNVRMTETFADGAVGWQRASLGPHARGDPHGG